MELSQTSTPRGLDFARRPKRRLEEQLSSWPGQGEEPNPKSFVLCRVFIPASGYMILTEQGRLETKKEGEWRLYGELKTRDTMVVDEFEVLLYEVSPELYEVV